MEAATSKIISTHCDKFDDVTKWQMRRAHYFISFLLLNIHRLDRTDILSRSRTTDTRRQHKSKISEKLGRCGRQNMLPPYLKIWEWE